jgi:hypothetical protein
VGFDARRNDLVRGEREKKAKHLKDLKMMNDFRQTVINGLGLGFNEHTNFLDNNIGLGLGREKRE